MASTFLLAVHNQPTGCHISVGHLEILLEALNGMSDALLDLLQQRRLVIPEATFSY
jgi:hypothetical protein